MIKTTGMISLLLGCYLGAFAQTNPETLKAKYEANRRDVKAVTEYTDALKEAKMRKEAEAVIKEYMARCPVIQLADKDTYLLINQYVFDDPYSNAFEYGIYAVRKMKWDREEKKLTGKQAQLMNIFKGMGRGVSGGDEIDKRYEVLRLLSNNLNKEIDKQCAPVLKETEYVLPEYNAEKVQRLNYLVNKGELLSQDGMRVKLRISEALQAKNYQQAIQELCLAATLNITDIRGTYLIGVLSVAANAPVKKEEIGGAIHTILNLSKMEKEAAENYYGILGKLYQVYGDPVNAKKYTQMGEAIEAERMARFNEMMKRLNQK